MGASGSIMAGIYGLQAVNSISSSQNQSRAIRAKGSYDAMIANSNARISDINAEDSIKRGDLAAGKVRRKASAVQGAQRVNLAAQGLDINSGSAADLQFETETMSQIDIDTVKNNAWREAWGYRVQADNQRGQANMAKIGAKFSAKQTALTGGLQALSYAGQGFYQYQKGKELDQVKEDILGKAGEAYQAEDSPTKPVQNSEPSRAIASAVDEGKKRRYRSRTNPIFGNEMTHSWFIRYDDEETG